MTYTYSSLPVAVSGITDATVISAGGFTTCAVLLTRDVDCWGLTPDYLANMGPGTTTYNSTPVPVNGIADVTAIAAGEEDDCALLSTAGVDCWGYNSGGQLGDGARQPAAPCRWR